MEAPPRVELGVKVLQTSALPLGYGAITRLAGDLRGLVPNRHETTAGTSRGPYTVLNNINVIKKITKKRKYQC